MPVAHISLPTGKNHDKVMRDFYRELLASLGYKIYLESEGYFGMAPKNGGPDFWLHHGKTEFDAFDGNVEKLEGKTHVAFTASSKSAVDNWYKTAIKAGAVCNGKPGERDYTKGYYAAYVYDPLGNNVEAVYYNPLWLQALTSAPYVLTALTGAGLAVAATVLSK